MKDIAERICQSPVLRKRTKLAKLLRYLADHDDGSGLTSADITGAGLFRTPEAVRTDCKRLRAALRFYFLYCREGRAEPVHIDLPAAPLDDKEVRDQQRRYKLIAAQALHRLDGAAAFWWAHFLVRPHDAAYQLFGTAMVFTEPLMFRDKQRRLFIRHLDINDHEEADTDHGDPISELMQALPQIRNRKDVVISRGYVPGGEVIAKDRLRLWLTDHMETIKEAGGHVIIPVPFVQEHISRKVPDINALDSRHCVLLGSSRANWVIRYFQKQSHELLPLTVEADGIVVPQCTSAEYHQMQERLLELSGPDLAQRDLRGMIQRKGAGALLKEDWTKVAFALVSRARSLDKAKKCTITALAANQGRGIQALGEHILTDDDAVTEVLKTFGAQHPLPKAFQMLFAVVLEDQESGYSKARWKPLLYRQAI